METDPPTDKSKGMVKNNRRQRRQVQWSALIRNRTFHISLVLLILLIILAIVLGVTLGSRSGDAQQKPCPLKWWQNATIYRIYVPSFSDSDGDGKGDFIGDCYLFTTPLTPCHYPFPLLRVA